MEAHLTAKELVLDELRALRRSPVGATVETVAAASTICRLLGAGDPYVAYTRLQHALIDASIDRPLRAAAASLGFSSGGDTHLARLDEAGGELGLDQRQVRRLSDQGLEVLATLIATNWTVEAVPALSATVVGDEDRFTIVISTIRPLVIEMSDPEVVVLLGDHREIAAASWRRSDAEGLERASVTEPLFVRRGPSQASVAVVWRGEIWPRFVVQWLGRIDDGPASETLGNKLLLRLTR